MSGPQDGKYLIQLAVDGPNLPIGVEFGGAPVKPVITEGSDNVWTVKKLNDGNYSLVLEQSGRPLFIQVDEGDLVGNVAPPPFSWTIRGKDGGPYTIEVPSGIIPTRGWTVKNPTPKSPVTVDFITIALPTHQWNFIPAIPE
jgi:hypothetical protein